MLHSSSLPKFSPSPRPDLIKALTLLGLAFLALPLSPRPALAQGSWGGFPCDAQGNGLPYNTYNNGFYTLYGPQSGTISHTYPQAMVNAALAYPDWYGDYLNAGSALGADMTGGGGSLGAPSAAVSSIDSPGNPNARVGGFTPGFGYAYNTGEQGESSYSVDAAHGGPSSGPVNGSVTADMSGTLLSYFKLYWSGSGTPTASADFLVSTQSYAQADIGYEGSQPPDGLSVTATATVDAFNETASASAGGGASSSGVQQVNGYHLVRAAVDPKTGIAEVYVKGTTHWVLSNLVPYATAGAAAAVGGSLVEAGAISDSRDVTISSSLGQTSHKSTIHFDSNGAALPDPDVPDADGTTNANSVKPDPSVDELITYSVAPNGSWAANSSYLWNVVQGNPYSTSTSGTFTLPNDPPYSYSALYPLANTTAGREHVYVHLTDAGDGANATNNYYIAWHDSVENWAKLGSSTQVAPKLFGTSESAQPANGYVNIKIAPDEVDWSVAEHDAGGVVTTAAAVLAIAQPETSPVVIGLMTAAGYTLSVATPPDPTIYTPQGTEAQFEADVDTQNAITNGDTAGIFSPGSQRMPSALAQQIAASGDYAGYFAGSHDHSFYFSVQAYRHRYAQPWIGDGYGSQGYYGRASGTITISGSYEYVYDWT